MSIIQFFATLPRREIPAAGFENSFGMYFSGSRPERKQLKHSRRLQTIVVSFLSFPYLITRNLLRASRGITEKLHRVAKRLFYVQPSAFCVSRGSPAIYVLCPVLNSTRENRRIEYGRRVSTASYLTDVELP